MNYRCVVLIKQVPDTKRITAKAMNDDGTVPGGVDIADTIAAVLNALLAMLFGRLLF